jgi:hypothetical protein
MAVAVGISTLLLAWKLRPTESHSAELELTPPAPSVRAVAEATFSSLASSTEGKGAHARIHSRPIAADCKETSSPEPAVTEEPFWAGGSVTDPDDNLRNRCAKPILKAGAGDAVFRGRAQAAGTVNGQSGASSSSGRSLARVASQNFGASSR